jgi:hypothetical protein
MTGAALNQKLNGFRHLHTAFKLHRVAAGFLHYPRRIAKSLHRRFLIAAKRHIDDDTATSRPPYHGGAMGDHYVERHTEGRIKPVKHHAD